MTLFFIVGLFLVGGAVVLLLRAAAFPRLRAERTVVSIAEYGYMQAPGEILEGRNSMLGPLDEIAAGVGLLFGRWLGFSRESDIRKHLLAAGLYRVDPRRLVGYQVLTGAAMALFWIWVVASMSPSGFFSVVGTIGCAAGGWYLPLLLVKRRARYRLTEIEYDLPELIDLLVVGVEAGLSFGAAMKACTERLRGPLGEEMRLLLQEQQMGLSITEALKNVLARVETPSVRTFVRAMIQGEQLGISVGQILRAIADEMRKRRKAAAEERAQKAPIKMLVPLIVLIFPAMFLIILGPAVFAFLDAIG